MGIQLSVIISVNESGVIVELGSGETKTAVMPRGMSAEVGANALVAQVSGKYIIINLY